MTHRQLFSILVLLAGCGGPTSTTPVEKPDSVAGNDASGGAADDAANPCHACIDACVAEEDACVSNVEDTYAGGESACDEIEDGDEAGACYTELDDAYDEGEDACYEEKVSCEDACWDEHGTEICDAERVYAHGWTQDQLDECCECQEYCALDELDCRDVKAEDLYMCTEECSEIEDPSEVDGCEAGCDEEHGDQACDEAYYDCIDECGEDCASTECDLGSVYEDPY